MAATTQRHVGATWPLPEDLEIPGCTYCSYRPVQLSPSSVQAAPKADMVMQTERGPRELCTRCAHEYLANLRSSK